MEKINYKTKLLALVTLYHPDLHDAAENILRYIGDVDTLIIWDNSPLKEKVREHLQQVLGTYADKIVWKGDGANRGIAIAINAALHYADKQGFDLLLLMDQDSRWEDFQAFRLRAEACFGENPDLAVCPYIDGNDTFEREQEIQPKRCFITSGTVIPVKLLQQIGGADESFPVDALDHDLAIRLQMAGATIVCLTQHTLCHQVGNACRMGPLHIFTNNYGPARTYSIARAHLIKYRKHRNWLTAAEKRFIIKEYYLLKLARILLAEPQKRQRLWMFFKGIYDGLTFDLSKTRHSI